MLNNVENYMHESEKELDAYILAYCIHTDTVLVGTLIWPPQNMITHAIKNRIYASIYVSVYIYMCMNKVSSLKQNELSTLLAGIVLAYIEQNELRV
jgi:hypothetical protein